MTYTLLAKWPHSSWSYVPEEHEITLAYARKLVKKNSHWQPCGLKQRIVNSKGKVIATYTSRLASKKRRDEIYRIHLPEVA